MQTTWMRRGTVSGRVALLLRSAEIQPPSHDLFDWFLPRNPIPPTFAAGRLQGGLATAFFAPKSSAVCPSVSTRGALGLAFKAVLAQGATSACLYWLLVFSIASWLSLPARGGVRPCSTAPCGYRFVMAPRPCNPVGAKSRLAGPLAHPL